MSTHYDIDTPTREVNADITKLHELQDDKAAQLAQLKKIVPEFNHMTHN
ncbi:MAG: hypothetical protein U9Q04_10355 [Campylobacterota bacterium]|nr:hypothetical protein [Campylobacterota bacterium]